jgi:hypothetical protein
MEKAAVSGVNLPATAAFILSFDRFACKNRLKMKNDSQVLVDL